NEIVYIQRSTEDPDGRIAVDGRITSATAPPPDAQCSQASAVTCEGGDRPCAHHPCSAPWKAASPSSLGPNVLVLRLFDGSGVTTRTRSGGSLGVQSALASSSARSWLYASTMASAIASSEA